MSEPGDKATRPGPWQADWRMTLFVILMLPLVLSLGFWQLSRADYKQGLETAYLEKLGALPVTPVAGDVLAPFSRVRLRGQYEDAHLLLDNQVSGTEQGYWVYTLFTAAGATWLVNRGWMAAPRLRSSVPVVPATPSAATTQSGVVALAWPDTGMVPLFGAQALERLTPDVVRMQRLDFDAISAELLQRWPNLVLQELRLEAAQPGVLRPVPQTMGFGVQRHQGYAFQWFGLAIALLTGYFFYGRSNAKSGGGNSAPVQTDSSKTSGE